MGRWFVYEALKGNTKFIDEVINNIDDIDIKEVREGVIEYLLARDKLCL